MRTHRLTSLSLLTLLGLSAAACSIRPEPEPEPKDLIPRTLYAFESCDDLLAYAKDNAKEALDEYGYFYGGGGWGVGEDLGAGSDGEGGDSGGDSGGAPEPGVDYSGTNVQELGIDEPDLVKTDGERIVALAEGKLHYVDTQGSEPVLRSSLALGELWGSEMFLYEDKVQIFQRLDYWQGHEGLPAEVQAWMSEYGTVTRITEIDLSNPDALKVVGSLYIRGNYVSARLFESTSRIVLQSFPTGLKFKGPWDFVDEYFAQEPTPPFPATEEEWQTLYAAAQASAKAHNKDQIDASTVENWLPQYFFHDVAGAGAANSSGLLYDCVDAMHPGSYSGLGVTSVLSVDLEKGLSPEGGIGLFAEGSIVYASAQNLYVATQPWFGQLWGGDGGFDGGGIDVDPEPIPDGGDPNTSVSTSASPGGGEGEPAPDADLLPAKFRADEEAGALSFVHKFELPAGEKAVYRASGEVRGRMLNQWAMSEHLGDLRVATTDQSGWDTSTSESFVSVLREDAGELVQIGQVGGLGAGEEIKSVRYIRDVAYVVTFRQTDPLYTVDLKDPSNPKVAGELKINGYSAYLHPISDTHLIGVGYDGTDEGQLLGVQISLFDVSDLANPIRTHQHALGDFGSTEVAFDHKAFLYWEPTDLAVFPVQSYSWNEEDWTESYFYGAVAYTVDAGIGIEPAGQITHMVDPLDPWKDGDPALRRSLVIGARLYTVSESGLKASELGSLADVKWINW